MPMRLLTALILFALTPATIFSQKIIDSSALSNPDISTKTLRKLSSFYTSLNTSINRQGLGLLQQMEKKEALLKSQTSDSTTSHRLFDNASSVYNNLEQKLKTPGVDPVNSLRNYIPGIDSMQTAIAFLSKSGLPVDKLQKLQALSQQLKQLQGSFQNARDVQDYLSQREDQLMQYGLKNPLAGVSEKAFYYQQQLTNYKNVLNDGQKQQQLLLTTVRQLPAFQSFWQKNSMLAQLFPAPANQGTLLAGAGLQTNAQVGSLIQKQLGTAIQDGGANATKFMQAQAGQAQGQIDQLKNNLDRLHIDGGGNSAITMPDFTPNGQKQHSFLKRLTYGFDIGSLTSTTLLPAISTLGLSVGYKASDKATIGVGVRYLLGLGNNISCIHLSNQGVGLRSFIDIRAKGSIWLTGGFEYNYMQAFASLKSIANLDIWQKSAVIGLMKKYSVAKKSGNVQLLYDLLSSQTLPRSQPLQVRFGYSF